jgi:leader peptidase (prepilin peptidase) / N-methyltransferase
MMSRAEGEASSGPAGKRMTRQAGQAALKYAAFAALGCAVALASLAAAPGYPGLFGGGLGLLMLAVALSDARAFIIPDRLTLAAFALGLAEAARGGFENMMTESVAAAAARGIALALAFLVLRQVYWRLRHRHGLGLGDVKLAAVAGAWLSWTLIPAAIEIAAVAALIAYLLSQLTLSRPLSWTAKLPFGLFFAPAIWLCWLVSSLFFAG